MRTSYNRGEPNVQNPVGKTVERVKTQQPHSEPVENFVPPVSEEELAIQSMIVTGFAEAKAFLDAKRSAMRVDLQSDDFGGNNSTNFDYKPQKENAAKKKVKEKKVKEKKRKTKKSNSKLSLVWVICLVLVLGVIVAGIFLVRNGVISFSNETEPTTEPTEPYEPQIGIIAEDINTLYVDDEKSDINDDYTLTDLNAFYSRLSEAAVNGEETDHLVNELDSIANYMSDESQLEVFENTEYDLSPDSFLMDVLKVKISADGYTVTGLRDTIYARADSLLAMRQEYLRIKSELSGVSNLLDFNGSVYAEAIKGITHTKNAEELKLLLAKVSADSAVVKAEAALSVAEGDEAIADAELVVVNAKSVQEKATKDWLVYIGEWVEESPTDPIEEPSTEPTVS